MSNRINASGKWVLVLGDQLDTNATIWQDFDKKTDAIWMAEASGESTHVWSSKPRIALFLSAMRHFRDDMRARGFCVHYRELEREQKGELMDYLREDIQQHQPSLIAFTRPGEWRILDALERLLQSTQTTHRMYEDDHFITVPGDFARFARGRKQLRMEYFYRELRKRFNILMDSDGTPAGGKWNYDSENRSSFPKKGPPALQQGPSCKPDSLTLSVLQLVRDRFSDHPGSLDDFFWPVSADRAEQLLEEFIENRLSQFGDYQDAMWTNEPWLYHSWLSAALNLKLLNPRTVCHKAEAAWKAGKVPLNAVEGFIRQILGWREYVRGIYWHYMPAYACGNALDANESLPDFYWTGKTDYTCLNESIGQTLRYGYAHHIQRLMVTGLYALLLGVKPKAIHEWYLAVYVDAVEWVELPNVIGMSQFADGGLMASKPYAATGKYIQRMSNYCSKCPKNPAVRTGPDACPFTTLYWDFLLRNQQRLRGNQRMSMQLRNLDRINDSERSAIRDAAAQLRKA